MKEELMLSIGDEENVIRILGDVYNDPRDALAEFITNAIEAKATKIYVFLHKRAREPYIQVSDDGKGMTKDMLKYVAKNIGNSLKRYDPKTPGEKGIGILGFQALAERCDLVSRGNTNRESFCLSLTAGTRKGSIEEEKERALQIRGTDVYLYGVGDDKWRMFTREKLANHFKTKFRLDLLSDACSLEIVEGKEATPVRPEAYKGEPFYIDTLRTTYGNIRLSLHILPSGKSCSISVYCKQIRVLNLADLPEFACEPWNLGKVQGEITADFLTPTTGRGSFIRDRKHFPTWVKAVKSIEKQLASEVEHLTKEYSTAQTRKLYKRLKLAFQRAIAELNLEGMRTRKRKPKPDDEKTEIKRGRGDEDVTRRGKIDRTDEEVKKRKKRKVRLPDFNWDEDDFNKFPELNPELRSYLDPKTMTIIANKAHPDYVKEYPSSERRETYFRTLTSKELTLYNYPKANPETLLEELVAIEVCVKRYL